MSDKRATFEQLLHGEVRQVSIINETIVDFAVEKPSAISIARQRWRCEPELTAVPRPAAKDQSRQNF